MRHARQVLVPVIILSTAVVAAPSAQADAEQHCVVSVVGQGADGRFITGPEACYPTFSEAMESLTPDDGGMGTTAFTIGTHYDGFNGSGSSLTVSGDSCSGGWLNLSSTWVNRISSTRNGCNRIAHFDGNNLTGSSESTYTVGSLSNLTSLNNATNSIQYLS